VSDRVARIADGIVFKQVGSEIVLLDFERGIYFGLDAVGARIWQLVADERSIAEILQTLGDEYDVTPEVLAQDVAELVEDLTAKGLLQRV
jgi:hypothetical protein